MASCALTAAQIIYAIERIPFTPQELSSIVKACTDKIPSDARPNTDQPSAPQSNANAKANLPRDFRCASEPQELISISEDNKTPNDEKPNATTVELLDEDDVVAAVNDSPTPTSEVVGKVASDPVAAEPRPEVKQFVVYG